MLDKLLGSKTAQKIFLHLYHYGETYPSAVANDFNLSLGQVQRQFDRFEGIGIIISRLSGRTRLYQFNNKHSIVKPFIEIIKIIYNSIPLTEKENLFSTRRRPRRRLKPVIGRN